MKDRKVLWYDVETSGLDAKENDITQFACKIFVNDVLVDQMNEFCQPFRYDTISQEALDITGKTIEDYKSSQPPKEMYNKMIKTFSKHVDKWDRKDWFYFGGYNVIKFDNLFLEEFFKKNGDKWLINWTHFRSLDPLVLLHWLNYRGIIDLKNYKLATVAEYFGITGDFHDALSDIDMTIKIYDKVCDIILGMNVNVL